MISQSTTTSEVDFSDSDSDQPRANGWTGKVPIIWSHAPKENTPLTSAMKRLKKSRENCFINELITSISQESLFVDHEAVTGAAESAYDDDDGESEFSVQTEETEVKEPKLLEKVGQVIQSWKSEVAEISKSIAHKKAMESKSRTDQWLRSQAKAKAERERIKRHEDRFVQFVESSEKKLAVTSQEQHETVQDAREFDIRYRPMRLIELNELGEDILTAESLYKSTFSHLSKNTACWITSKTQDEEIRKKLQTALEEVHGQVDLNSDFWDPAVITDKSLRAQVEFNQPKNAFKKIDFGADLKDEDVPELITSREMKPSFRPQLPDLSILSANAFQEFQSKSMVSKILEPAAPARDYWDMTNLD